MDDEEHPYLDAYRIMKELRTHVDELQAGLLNEQQTRTQQVASLKEAIAQEQYDREALVQRLGQSLNNEAARLEGGIHRCRLTVGELRAELSKEQTDRISHGQDISEHLAREVGRLTGMLDELRENHGDDLVRLASTQEADRQENNKKVTQLDAKVTGESSDLKASFTRINCDNEMLRSAAAEDREQTGRLIRHLTENQGWMLNHMKGVTSSWAAFQNYQSASAANFLPDCGASDAYAALGSTGLPSPNSFLGTSDAWCASALSEAPLAPSP